MAKITLPEQTEVGPLRGGEAKPGAEQIPSSGLKDIGTGLFKFVGPIFTKLVGARAANEEAVFKSSAKVTIEEFETFVATNPGAPFEVLEAKRNEMMEAIRQAGGQATTGIARRNIKQWLDNNEELIAAKTQGAVEAIGAKQEIASYQLQRKNLINSFDREGLAELTGDMVDAGLLNKEVAEFQMKNDLDIIDAAETKVLKEQAIENTTGAAFDVWQATVTEKDPDGDLNAAFDFIQNSDIPDDEKGNIERDTRSRIANRRAEKALELESAQEEQLTEINELVFNAKDYQTATQAVLGSDLDEKAKTSLLITIEGRASAAARGVPIKNNRVVENEMYEMSLDIWRGNVTKRQFDKELLRRAKVLDDNAFKRVTASAADTLKTSQAQALSRADEEAADVLVDFKEEDAFAAFLADSIAGLEPDIADAFRDDANERRQLQFNNLAQYNFEARQWVADNPDKTGRDFFQFKESLKQVYWNKNIDELRALREKQSAEATGQSRSEKQRRLEELRAKAAR